ncbi:hypothetical protein [Streptomyces hydrogenans]|uniref:hypothetical protein n=1 Tax=Streptomyces hydrogenans TaxID=1873719 RepID=UPI0033309313
MQTETRAHETPTTTARLHLMALGLLRAAVPPLAAVGAALAVEPYLDAGGRAHIACLVLVGLLAMWAADNVLDRTTEDAYRQAYGRVHGPRSWSCQGCGRRIDAQEWTPYDAAVFETHLADPRAHGCAHS